MRFFKINDWSCDDIGITELELCFFDDEFRIVFYKGQKNDYVLSYNAYFNRLCFGVHKYMVWFDFQGFC
jgi:hypothetical protein